MFKVDHFQEVEWQEILSEEASEDFSQVDYLGNFEIGERFDVVPEHVLVGVFVIDVCEELLAEEAVEGVVRLFGEAALEQYSHGLSFLSLLQVQMHELLVGIHVVVCAHDGLEDGLLDVGDHVHLLG